MTCDCNDPRIDKAIELFNQREFYECHDVLEDFWSELTGPEKTFFQGLIHAAVCLFHFEGHNLTGARKMYHSFCAYVGDFPPHFCNIDVVQLLLDMEFCFEELLQQHNGYPHHVTLQEDRIPRIRRTKIA